MIFDLSLLLVGLILMVIGQITHWLLQLYGEIKDKNNPNMSIKDFICDNQNLMIINFGLVTIAAVLNAFTALLPAAIPLGLAGAGYAIDSFLARALGDKLKKNGK